MDFQRHPPNSRDNNYRRAESNWRRQEQIYRFNVRHYKAVQKSAMFGLMTLQEVHNKFPGALTDVDCPVVTTWSRELTESKY